MTGDLASQAAERVRADAETCAVLVVGAGPTGLLIASELQRRGVPCHLIDARPAPSRWNRATVIHPLSLQIFESLGLAKRFLDAGCRQRVIKLHSNGQVLGTMNLATCGSIYGFNLGQSQEVTESILTGYLHEQGGTVNRSSRLVGLTMHDDGVLAEIERDGYLYQVRAKWIVGCDGVRSAVRELGGIGFEGHDIAQPWAVFDATLVGWAESFETTFVYFDTLPVILTAIPGHRWRVYLRPSSEQADLVADAASTVSAYAPAATFVDVENPARFQCHTRMAAQFRSGPVFLAGDAAHVCTPAQGHGMNCGLQDAFNLAWKLALVYHGAADAGLLDSYEAERRPAADMVARSGDVMERALTMRGAGKRDRRDRELKAMLADPKARHLEILAEAELNVDYCRSPLVFGDANYLLAAGHSLPDAIPVEWPDGKRCGLHALAHRAGHTLMLLGGRMASVPMLLDLQAALRVLVVESPLFEAAVALSACTGLPLDIGYLEPSVVDLLGVGGITLLVMRPDGYVGLRADGDHLNALDRYRTLIGTDVLPECLVG